MRPFSSMASASRESQRERVVASFFCVFRSVYVRTICIYRAFVSRINQIARGVIFFYFLPRCHV